MELLAYCLNTVLKHVLSLCMKCIQERGTMFSFFHLNYMLPGIITGIAVFLWHRSVSIPRRMYVSSCSWMSKHYQNYQLREIFLIIRDTLDCGRWLLWGIYLTKICAELERCLNFCHIGFSLLLGNPRIYYWLYSARHNDSLYGYVHLRSVLFHACSKGIQYG